MDYIKIDKKVFDNIYNPQLEEFKSKTITNEDHVLVPFKDTQLKMQREDTNKNIIAVSMFSGAGGLDIGAYLAGIDIAYASDIESDCIETLKMNDLFKKTKNVCININDIKISDLKAEISEYDYDELIVIGGPPCQPFSKAGYWVTNEKRDSYNDERNMIPSYFRIIGGLKPSAVILENVESILHPSNVETVEYIESQFRELGYNMLKLKLNAAEFGLPQKRKRVFFIATKKEIEFNLVKTNSDKKNSKLPDFIPVVNWIGSIDEKGKLVTEGKWSQELSEIPPGKNYIALSERENHPNPRFIAGKRYWSSLQKLDPLLPSWTIIASPGHWEGPFHWENRRLSNAEAAAIQTFPRDYKFFGSERSVRKQIGNAVPPLLAKKIFKELIRCLEN